MAQLISAALLVLLPRQIARIYTTDQGVISMAAQLLILAAVFQVSDGIQVTATGALRGLKTLGARC